MTPGKCLLAGLLLATLLGVCSAQEPPRTDKEAQASAGGRQVPDWIRIPAYVRPTTDPAAVERGHSLFVANGCSFCHGEDARGGNGGPNLARSQLVLSDKHGETIGTPIRKGVAGTAMVAFQLTDAQISDISQYLHSIGPYGRNAGVLKPAVFQLGDARGGKRYFAAHCAACHSIDGDLKGIAARFGEPRALQQHWLMPRTRTPTHVTITRADGTQTGGELVRMDEFLVTFRQADGAERTIERRGDQPQVSIDSPIAAHKAMLPDYRDSDIHDVTAYLATLK